MKIMTSIDCFHTFILSFINALVKKQVTSFKNTRLTRNLEINDYLI